MSLFWLGFLPCTITYDIMNRYIEKKKFGIAVSRLEENGIISVNLFHFILIDIVTVVLIS